MEHKNIWESNLNDKCQYINNIDEFLKFLEDNNRYDFIISEKLMPNDKSQFILDEISNKKNICITYTNNEHNVTVFTLSQFQQTIIVNPTFFEAYKDKITEYIKNKINTLLTEKQYYIKIPDFLIDDNLINELINNKNLENITIKFFNITEKDLTAEQIKKLKSKHLEVYYDGNKISTNKLIDYYTLKDLQKIKTISISQTLTNEEIENFIYINDDTIITIKTEYSASRFNEQEYLNNLIRICNILKTHNKKYNIKIDINNRELLKQSGLLNIPNINFTINNDLYEYKQEEYLKEEEQLDKLIEPIKNSNLSPYEKYLAVYNIVKQFKPYKENNENKEESRYLRYILNNEYIVCVGFSKLLTTLLDKAGIPAMNISVGVDTSYDDGFTMEDKPTNIEGHQRNIIKIDDDKYNIHGIFALDITWDSDKEVSVIEEEGKTTVVARPDEEMKKKVVDKYDSLILYRHFLIPMQTYEERYPEEEHPAIYEAYRDGKAKKLTQQARKLSRGEIKRTNISDLYVFDQHSHLFSPEEGSLTVERYFNEPKPTLETFEQILSTVRQAEGYKIEEANKEVDRVVQLHHMLKEQNPDGKDHFFKSTTK